MYDSADSADSADSTDSADSADSAHIRWGNEPPTLRAPVLLAAFEGWNDAGHAATMAARHFISRWNATETANIDPEHFYDFISTRPHVAFDQFQTRTLTWPTNAFLTCSVSESEQDLVILLGVEPNLKWRTFCNEIIETAKRLNVSHVVTLGSLLSDIPHNRPVEVYGSSTNEETAARLSLKPSDYEGPTGIVGVLSTQSRESGLPTTSFWSTVPNYVAATPSPKAGLALVQKVSALFGVSVFATDLELAAANYEEEVAEYVASDEDTASYVASLQESWDNRSSIENANFLEMNTDPDALLAEVEDFLRGND